MRVEDLAVVVGEQRRARAVQHACASARRATPRRPPRRRSGARRRPATKSVNMPIAFEPPPTHAITASGSRPSAARICSRASRPITRCSSRTSSGIRRGPDARADQVVGRVDVGDPVADRLARRLLQRARAELDRPHLGAEQPHPLDVGRLAPHVLAAHVDDALEPEVRADGRGRDAVLAGARLGDDPLLAEPPRDHRLTERVVDLVRAGVQQVLALQVDALVGREARGARERGRPARVGRAAARRARRGTRRRCAASPTRRVSSSSAGISVSGHVPAAVGAEGRGVIAPPRPTRARRRGP